MPPDTRGHNDISRLEDQILIRHVSRELQSVLQFKVKGCHKMTFTRGLRDHLQEAKVFYKCVFLLCLWHVTRCLEWHKPVAAAVGTSSAKAHDIGGRRPPAAPTGEVILLLKTDTSLTFVSSRIKIFGILPRDSSGVDRIY